MDLSGRHPAAQVGKKPLPVGPARLLLEPAPDRVVVMRPRVDEIPLDVPVGRMVPGALAIPEGELQDPHARQCEPVQFGAHIRGDVSQILCHQPAPGNLAQEHPEEIPGRYGRPFSPGRGFVTRRDLPVGDQSPAVIDADEIEEFQVVADPVDPPGIAAFLQSIPVVYRVSPELPCPAEVVGRHPGDKGSPSPRVELEQGGVCPDIGAVVVHVAGQIPHDGHAETVAVIFQGPPLPEEQVLTETLPLCEGRHLHSARQRGFHAAPAQLPRPAVPCLPPVDGLESPEQAVIVEPLLLVPAECFVLIAEASCAG